MTNSPRLSGLDTTSKDGIDLKKLWPIKHIDLPEYNQTHAQVKKALRIGMHHGVGFRWCKIRDELSYLQRSADYNKFIYELTDAALYYSTSVYKIAQIRKGAPAKSNIRVLMYDVRLALKNLLGREVGLHQTQATDEGKLYIIESAASAISRLVAERVGIPFTKNVRNHIRKTQHIHLLKQ